MTNEQTKNSWISVDDELPKEGEIVLIFNPKYGTNTVFGGVVMGAAFKSFPSFTHEEPTHWQPLPLPPRKISYE